MTIGEVIAALRDEFPDVTVSKVRFLESQGLLHPGRSESGYRQFGPADIERLKFILTQQRDHFLPLKVIKSRLTLWERGEDLDDVPVAEELDGSERPVDRDELLRRSGLNAAQLASLVEQGFLEPIDGEREVYPAPAVGIATEARRLFDAGYETRHMRAIRLAVDREADLLRQLTAPLLKLHNPDARARARDTLAGCADAMNALHRALLAQRIRDLLES